MHILHLLHISDLHITNNPVVMNFRERRFNALSEAVEAYRKHVDGYLITGDIADNTISINDLFYAKSLLFSNPVTPQRNPYVSLYPLNFDDKPVILLPGNHDRYQFPGMKPGSTVFDEVFRKQWRSVGEGVAFHLFPHKDAPLLMIVCIDFSLKHWSDSPVRMFYMGQGKAYPERLKKLKEVTDMYGNLPVVWAMHFAPSIDTKIIPEHLELSQSQNLIDAANDKKIKHILCGHYHKLIDYAPEIKKQVTVYCSGSATDPEPGARPSIQVIRIIIKNNAIKRLETVPLIFNRKIFSRDEP